MDFTRIMKQPELGKKIMEARKARGLTQEELVDKCSLNVRTLQRIESGEVTPRTHTIRSLFAALDIIAETEESNRRVSPKHILWLEQLYWYSKDLFNLRTNTMKKISILTIITCALALGLVSMFSETKAQSNEKVRKIIEENSKNFIRWYNQGSLDSLVSMYDKEACLTGYGCGHSTIRQHYGNQMRTGFEFKSLVPYSVVVEKSTAVEKGLFTMVLPGGQEISGEYITQWKQIGKTWLIVNDTANVTNTDEANKG